MQAHYGALDRRALAELPDLEEHLREAGRVNELRVHAGLGPAFWERWTAAAPAGAAAAAASTAAWRATVRWFATHLPRHAPPGPAAAASVRPRPN